MNEQFIQRLSINWDKVESSSYLRKIEAIKALEEIFYIMILMKWMPWKSKNGCHECG